MLDNVRGLNPDRTVTIFDERKTKMCGLSAIGAAIQPILQLSTVTAQSSSSVAPAAVAPLPGGRFFTQFEQASACEVYVCMDMRV